MFHTHFKLLRIVRIICICCCLLGTLMSAPLAQASSFAAPFEADGYAWSSTIGWISMNCSNDASCGTSNYKVQVETDGRLTGYAWSSNIGWIKFDGLSNFPAGAGTVSQDARLVDSGTGYRLEGWIRACAGTASGDCSTMTSRTDGWDGWIALRGDVPALPGSTYGVTTNTSLVVDSSSFAWGGPVVGWMAWGPAGPNPGVRFNIPPKINAFTITPSEVRQGNTVTVTWDTEYADECIASNNNSDPGWQDTPLANMSGVRTFAPVRGVTTYTLTCRKSGHADLTQTQTVTVRPNLVISAFSQTPPVTTPPPITGIYPQVRFSANVQGLSPGDVVNYRLQFGTNVQTGTYTASTNTFSPLLRFTSIPFGTYGPVRLEMDLPAPGSVAEDLVSTAGNEDTQGNSRSVADITLLAPVVAVNEFAPVQPFVRNNTPAAIRYSLSAPYVATCTIVGPGLSHTVVLNGAPGAPDTEANTVTTGNLTSASVYTLTCTVDPVVYPGVDPGAPQTTTVQVTPRIEEL
jgi:hypothetical protein